MIKKILLTFFILFIFNGYSQVGIGTTSPDLSSTLDISSTNSGVLVPRMSQAQRNLIATPATGLLIYQTDNSPGFYYFDGVVWTDFGSKNWKLTGNSGTVAATNFIGTTDGIDFVTRTNNLERMRLSSAGNLGVEINNPLNKFDLSYGTRTGVHPTGLPFYATGNINTNSSGFEFRHLNGTQGIGLGFNTIYATGSNVNQDLGFASRGTGNILISTNSLQRITVLGSNGNTGIGVANPSYNLELNGSFGYGNGTSGVYRSRTETRNDAGQIASQSGFFETSAPTNFPAGASSWWHLIDTRHSNNANNYALQIAGSFFDQELWFRKTNNSATTAWSRLLTTNSGWSTLGNAGTNAAINFIGTTDGIDFVTRTNNFERMRVTSNGNVGVGIYPAYKFDVSGLGGSNIDFRSTGRIWTNSASGGMWLSDLQDSFMGNISTTQFGFWSSTVGWNALNITKTNGYVGIGTSAPSSRLHVVSDGDNIPVIYGVNSNNSAGTTSFGVRGECGSTGLGSAGVSGVSTNSSQNEIGVLGDYSLWGTGVYGLGWAGAYTDMPSTRDFGVFGTVNYFTGTGVYGRNSNTTVGSAYGVYCNGNFAVTGAKSGSVPTTKGNQLVYCTESPELWFEDIGGGKLVNGSLHVTLDSMFLETIFVDNEHPIRVFIQEEGENNGLIVIKDSDNKGFTVKEKNNGTSNVDFSYRIMAKRRFYQNQRFGVDANQPFEDNLSKSKDIPVTTANPDEMRRFVDEKTALKEAMGKKLKN